MGGRNQTHKGFYSAIPCQSHLSQWASVGDRELLEGKETLGGLRNGTQGQQELGALCCVGQEGNHIRASTAPWELMSSSTLDFQCFVAQSSEFWAGKGDELFYFCPGSWCTLISTAHTFLTFQLCLTLCLLIAWLFMVLVWGQRSCQIPVIWIVLISEVEQISVLQILWLLCLSFLFAVQGICLLCSTRAFSLLLLIAILKYYSMTAHFKWKNTA